MWEVFEAIGLDAIAWNREEVLSPSPKEPCQELGGGGGGKIQGGGPSSPGNRALQGGTLPAKR